jgi:hypothetical protein
MLAILDGLAFPKLGIAVESPLAFKRRDIRKPDPVVVVFEAFAKNDPGRNRRGDNVNVLAFVPT